MNFRSNKFIAAALVAGMTFTGVAFSQHVHAPSSSVSTTITAVKHSVATQAVIASLDPNKGSEIGAKYQAWLSPHQEGGEERDTPSYIPKVFLSSTPSVDRDKRSSRGHGVLRFTKDLSKAYVDVKITGFDPKTTYMFHIHCGKPGILGPIIIDFGKKTDLKAHFAKTDTLSVELKNQDLVDVFKNSSGPIDFKTLGCPIIPSDAMSARVMTIAGMAQIAREGELYFNFHTTGQAYFGDMRGQLEAMKNED